MSRYGKTYPLGSREAMKREPSLDEEDYLQDPEVEAAMSIFLGKEFSSTYADLQREARLKASEDQEEVIPNELRLLGMPDRQKD